MSRRRRFIDNFKAKVAREALWGDQTLSRIAARHNLHPNQISQWKRQTWMGLVVCSRGQARRTGR